MKRVGIIAISALLIFGCMPSPRFSQYGSTTPKQMVEPAEWRRTEDYLKFGMIVQRYIGKPYSGSSRFQPGIDCSLFTQEVMREYANITLPRASADQYHEGVEVPRNKLLYGDLVFFSTERDKVTHVGLYIGFGEFIHASTSLGVIVSALNESYWVQRYVGARRILK